MLVDIFDGNSLIKIKKITRKREFVLTPSSNLCENVFIRLCRRTYSILFCLTSSASRTAIESILFANWGYVRLGRIEHIRESVSAAFSLSFRLCRHNQNTQFALNHFQFYRITLQIYFYTNWNYSLQKFTRAKWFSLCTTNLSLFYTCSFVFCQWLCRLVVTQWHASWHVRALASLFAQVIRPSLWYVSFESCNITRENKLRQSEFIGKKCHVIRDDLELHTWNFPSCNESMALWTLKCLF